MPKKNVDILIEVPYLWFHDGYGHTTPEVISMVGKFAEENNLTWGVQRAHVLTNTNELSKNSREIMKHFISAREVGEVNLLFRYHYPRSDRRGGAKKLITYTMFETDKCPDAWISHLDSADLVLVTTPFLKDIFQKATSTTVETLYLPLHEEYYEIQDNDTLIKNLPDDMRFSFVGTTNDSNDRKGIIELCKEFSIKNWGDKTNLVVKSRGFHRKFNNVISEPPYKSLKSLIPFYCSSHAGVYPSHGEGYGLPQMESSLLGRPVIIADNTAMIWAKSYMPWVISVPCVSKPASYSSRVPGDVGNWGYSNITDFLREMEILHDFWKENKDSYRERIIESHLNSKLREELDREKIYQQLSKYLTTQLEVT